MIVDSLETLEARMAEVREAQRKFALYTQEEVDRIFLAAATAANRARIPLAKAAVEETGMGVLEDKIFKNHFAAEYIYNYYKNVKTCGVIEEDKEFGTQKIAEPVGVIAAVIPTTNPTSTAIFKTLLALKTRKRNDHQPAPAREELDDSRGEDDSRRGGRGWSARGHHRMDRRSVAGADERRHARR